MKGEIKMKSKKWKKMSKDELNTLMYMRKRSFVRANKKGKGSYERKNKIKDF